MGDTAAFYNACDFQAHRVRIEVVEQAHALPEQNWHLIDVDFVEQSSVQQLLNDAVPQ